MAEFWAITTAQQLKSLPPDIEIIRGCIKYPNRSPDDWRRFKRRFSSLLSRSALGVALVAKQHITKNDIHFDFIGYTPQLKASQQRIRAIAKQCDGNATCVQVARDEIVNCTNYVFKYATDKKTLDSYMRWHYLPSKENKFATTWTLGNFWQRQPAMITTERYWDGELKIVKRKMSGQQQVWREYLVTICGDGIPEYTTPEYRASQTLKTIVRNNHLEQLPKTRQDWKATLNMQTDYTDGVRIAPIIVDGKCSGYSLVESGSGERDYPSISDRLTGTKPIIQQVCLTSEADYIRRCICPPKAKAKPIYGPVPEVPDDLLCCAEDFADSVCLGDGEWEAELMAM